MPSGASHATPHATAVAMARHADGVDSVADSTGAVAGLRSRSASKTPMIAAARMTTGNGALQMSSARNAAIAIGQAPLP